MVDPLPHTEPHPDVAGYLLGTLDEAEALAFAEHLPGCAACRSELTELARLPGLLAQAPPAEALPAGLEERTFAAIDVAAIEAGAIEAAASEAAAIGAAANSMSRPEPGRDEPGAPAAVIPIAKARRDRGRGPARLVMAVAAAGGPAHGTATIRTSPAGLIVDMVVDGLAPNRPGTMYTCWLVGPGDTIAHQNRVSVGSFVVPSNRTVHVHWTTAADRSRFTHMGVTIEPVNGDPRHQGPKVLAGP